MLDGETVAREIPDLDGDGVAESWETRRDLCGSGGCTYTIDLSSHPDETLGEVFGVNFTPFSSLYLDGPPSADTYPTFNAEARGGYCDYSITRMKFDEATRKYVEGLSIDCHAVINRISAAAWPSSRSVASTSSRPTSARTTPCRIRWRPQATSSADRPDGGFLGSEDLRHEELEVGGREAETS